MTKKIIRLTESQLQKVIQKILKENNKKINEDDEEMGPFATHPIHGDRWIDAKDRVTDEPTSYSEEREFGPDEYEDFMQFINDCDTRWCLKTKKYYDTYASKGNIKVRK